MLLGQHDSRGDSHNVAAEVAAKLRKELFEKDRENDKLLNQIQSLQAQLAQRPPLSSVQELENEKKTLEMILQGTQRENEKMMAELERGKKRERILEGELSKLLGDNWQNSLDLGRAFSGSPTHPHGPTTPLRSPSHPQGHAANTSVQSTGRLRSFSADLGESPLSTSSSSASTSSVTTAQQSSLSQSQSSAHGKDGKDGRENLQVQELHHVIDMMRQQLEQAKLQILGMDQRLTERQDKLEKVLKKAEKEGKRFDEAVSAGRGGLDSSRSGR
jgi:hypothetical protein